MYRLPGRTLPVYEGIVKAEFQDELAELILDLGSRILRRVKVWWQNTQGVYRLAIHLGARSKEYGETVLCSEAQTFTGRLQDVESGIGGRDFFVAFTR